MAAWPVCLSAGVSRQSILLISVLNEQSNPRRRTADAEIRSSHDTDRGAECLRLTERLAFKSKVQLQNTSEGSKQAAIQHQLHRYEYKQYFFRYECDMVKYIIYFTGLCMKSSPLPEVFDGPYMCKWFLLGHDSFHS